MRFYIQPLCIAILLGGLIFFNALAQSVFPEENYLLPFRAEYKPFSSAEFPTKIAQAEKGTSAETYYNLGMMYWEGNGTTADPLRAIKWLEKAAETGHAPAQVALALCYKERGEATRGIAWLHKAAKAKNPQALYELGILYETDSRFYDSAKAYKFYEVAAKAGVRNAMIKQAARYHYGRAGTAIDLKKAAEIYASAAEQGDEAMRLRMAQLLASLYAQIGATGANQEEMFAWNKKAADLGDKSAKVKVAEAYFQGIGTRQDISQAITLYKELALREDLHAMKMLGYIYSSGAGGIAVDYKNAAEWYLRAAQAGDAESAWTLGNFYLSGSGVERSEAKAKQWFTRAKELQKQ